MNSKPHRNNSNFQLKHFMAGSCHTPDGAWALLYEQKIDIASKIEHSKAQGLRRQAKIMDAEEVFANTEASETAKLRAQAEILECNAGYEIWKLNHEAAEQEYAYICELMDRLEPLRKYAHLPMLEANETMQQEEWLGELKARAENFLLTSGTIPHDHLNTMRCHPDFASEIVPHIDAITQKVLNCGGDRSKVLTNIAPPFLEHKGD
jgi:hypothetical protein